MRRRTAPDLGALRSRVSGPVVAQGDPGYDAARLLYSPRFDGVHPHKGDSLVAFGWAMEEDLRKLA